VKAELPKLRNGFMDVRQNLGLCAFQEEGALFVQGFQFFENAHRDPQSDDSPKNVILVAKSRQT